MNKKKLEVEEIRVRDYLEPVDKVTNKDIVIDWREVPMKLCFDFGHGRMQLFYLDLEKDKVSLMMPFGSYDFKYTGEQIIEKSRVKQVNEIFQDSSNTELYKMLENLQKEIMLSETAIKEGQEKKK